LRSAVDRVSRVAEIRRQTSSRPAISALGEIEQTFPTIRFAESASLSEFVAGVGADRPTSVRAGDLHNKPNSS